MAVIVLFLQKYIYISEEYLHLPLLSGQLLAPFFIQIRNEY